MTSERSREPEDHAVAALRARLRHKMFGVGLPSPPSPAEVPVDVPESRIASASIPLPVLGWVVPSVAVLALAATMLWQRHTADARPLRPAPVSRLSTATRMLPEADPAPAPANEGPRLLAAAQDDPVARMAAVRASWADVDAPERLDAAVALAQGLREEGDPRGAIGLLRTVLDELELGAADRAERARLLEALALAYEALGREPAAEATRAEAQRLVLGR